MEFDEQLYTIINDHYTWKPITGLSEYDKYKSIAQTGINLVDDLNHNVLYKSNAKQLARIADAFRETMELYNPEKKYIHSLINLLIRKNHDYGSSFAKVALALGTIPTFSVRFLDKCNRLNNLLKDNENTLVADESLTDTVNDLLGYYVLCSIMLKYKRYYEK